MIKKILRNNTTWSLGANGAIALLGFVNLALIAHGFSRDDTGKWFMLVTLYTLLEMLRSGWVQTPFVRYYIIAEDDIQRARLTGGALQLMLFFTLIISVVVLFVFYFIRIDNSAFALAKKFTVLWLVASLPYQLLQWQLQARGLFKKLSAIKMIFPVAFSILLLLQLRFELKIETMVLLYALLQFIAGFLGMMLGWLHVGTWRLNLSLERKMLINFGKYSMVTMVAASLLRSSDQFIIAAWLGPAAVAVYAIPQKLIEVIEVPVRSFASIAIPKATSLYSHGKISELKQFFYRQCGSISILVSPLLIIFFCFPSYIVNLLGGAKYHESSLLLQIFCFYAALIPIDRYCGVLLDAGNMPKKNTIKVITMLVLNVTLDVLALQLGTGIYGVAAGSTLTFLFGIIVGWLQLKDILGVFRARSFWNEGIMHPLNTLKNYSSLK